MSHQVCGPEPATGSYFVATYPPFSCWQGAEVQRFRERLERPLDPDEELGLYVHVPFCSERCQFCYYLSYDDRPRLMSEYVDAVVDEARRYAELPAVAGRAPGYVYFGGGTPSLLPMGALRRLLEGLQACLPWDRAREVSFECAPKSVSRPKLELLRDAGVTRISLGAQQIDDDVLALNGRVHLTADVEQAYAIIRDVGFDQVNVDLMVGLVGETEETFQRSLERLLCLGPDSVTIYQLEIPHSTPLYRAQRDGRLDRPLDGWDEKHARLGRGFARLEAAGYTLRSAYTAVRDPERHRFVYQDSQYRGSDLLGIGASSFSYLGGWNQQNMAAVEPYMAAIASGELPIGRALELDDEERLVREVVLQMKLGAVDLGRLRAKFGVDPLERFAEPVAHLEEEGMATVEDDQLRLSREGLLRVDHLLLELYLPRHRDLRYS